MEIKIPEFSLIVLMGPSGAGKSTFARKHFQASEILSSDFFQKMVCDHKAALPQEEDAFDALNFILEKRLKNKCLTVIDANNTQQASRKQIRLLARKYHARLIAIVLDLPEKVCLARNEGRSSRDSSTKVRKQVYAPDRLKAEGFRYTKVLTSVDEVDAVTFTKEKMRSDRRHETGPFDLIGDVHGCRLELEMLLQKLGYTVEKAQTGSNLYYNVGHAEGRRLIFVGDLVDRGPDAPGVLKLVISMVRSGLAFCVPGNHDDKLARKLQGRKVNLKHGLAETMEQLAQEPPAFQEEVRNFIQGLSTHLVFNGGDLVVAHAGLKAHMHGRSSGEIHSFCLYGETTGETDEYGLPVRLNWAENYQGDATVVYGHTPVPHAEWLNHTIDIDTGCVFGGKLSALRYPERTLVSVPAAQVYAEPRRPLFAIDSGPSSQPVFEEVLDSNFFQGRPLVTTRLLYNISVKEGDAQTAMELMNRYGINPKWLIYLPPAMSPPKTSTLGNYLEHPLQAFEYYRKKGLSSVMVQEKHKGSRAVVILCKDEQVASRRFGIQNEGIGVVYSRTGRALFKDKTLEQALLTRLRTAVSKAELWEALETDWLCLDCELMPWSLKAEGFIREQYAAMGAAGAMALPKAISVLERAAKRGVETAEISAHFRLRETQLQRFVHAYQHHVVPVAGLEDFRLAPFHVMASEGKVHTAQPHLWHIGIAQALQQADSGLVQGTQFREVDLHSDTSIREATAWWEALTAEGGEGIVVKPSDFLQDEKGDIVQPAIKVRGHAALRLIYGPEYDSPENIKKLRIRSLKTKRALALREFALGHEALYRFQERKTLNEVHQCILALIGLKSTPMDVRI